MNTFQQEYNPTGSFIDLKVARKKPRNGFATLNTSGQKYTFTSSVTSENRRETKTHHRCKINIQFFLEEHVNVLLTST